MNQFRQHSGKNFRSFLAVVEGVEQGTNSDNLFLFKIPPPHVGVFAVFLPLNLHGS